MKVTASKNLLLLIVLTIACFGCSVIDSLKKSVAESNSKTVDAKPADNSSTAEKKTETSSDSAPCENKYYPVSDGAVKNYKMSLGGHDAKFVQAYKSGASDFTEEMTIGGITVKHNWECTKDGLVAANPGSMLDSKSLHLEPKLVSGVTLPNDGEIQVGKTWTTVYQATGKSPLGDVLANVTMTNKVTAMDDEVKVPAGTYKAVKVETNTEIEMKMGGTSYPVPAVKSYVWFAPNVGTVKNAAAEGTFGNSTMEYAGDK